MLARCAFILSLLFFLKKLSKKFYHSISYLLFPVSAAALLALYSKLKSIFCCIVSVLYSSILLKTTFLFLPITPAHIAQQELSSALLRSQYKNILDQPNIKFSSQLLLFLYIISNLIGHRMTDQKKINAFFILTNIYFSGYTNTINFDLRRFQMKKTCIVKQTRKGRASGLR